MDSMKIELSFKAFSSAKKQNVKDKYQLVEISMGKIDL